MKFRCERDVLVEALTVAGRAVTTRGGALPVLAGVRMSLEGDSLEVTGSDLDLTMSVKVTVAGENDGVIVVPSKLASDVVRSLESGAVHLEVEDTDVRITAGRSEFALRTIPADEFPRLPEPTGDDVTLESAALSAALKQVVKAASSDDSRPILTGVLVTAEEEGSLRLVATDSYRLAVRDLPNTTVLSGDQSVLVPSRALAELGRLLGDSDAQVRFGERDATFTVGEVTISTRLIEGDFPNYKGLIPSNQPNRLTVGRETLLEAVRRVRLLAQESTPVRLAMSNDGLELIAMTQDVGQAHEEVAASYEGEELTVAFNPEYLIDGIDVSAGDEVVLETVDALKPVLLRTPGDEDFLYLLMPVRVS